MLHALLVSDGADSFQTISISSNPRADTNSHPQIPARALQIHDPRPSTQNASSNPTLGVASSSSQTNKPPSKLRFKSSLAVLFPLAPASKLVTPIPVVVKLTPKNQAAAFTQTTRQAHARRRRRRQARAKQPTSSLQKQVGALKWRETGFNTLKSHRLGRKQNEGNGSAQLGGIGLQDGAGMWFRSRSCGTGGADVDVASA
uniref:Uncharacterized protein n=1 Tax=Mycena chlorophos TaxID=658473 RepID=A0ABQ0L932_MYCCL|nr:predicted protein [Mycena chlorophos]